MCVLPACVSVYHMHAVAILGTGVTEGCKPPYRHPGLLSCPPQYILTTDVSVVLSSVFRYLVHMIECSKWLKAVPCDLPASLMAPFLGQWCNHGYLLLANICIGVCASGSLDENEPIGAYI